MFRNSARWDAWQSDLKEWRCRHCSYHNRAIYVGNRKHTAQPKCICCGDENTATASPLPSPRTENKLQLDRHDSFSAFKLSGSLLLDDHIVEEWNRILTRDCEGIESEYIDDCPQVQKLQFVMQHYSDYIADQSQLTITMTELVNNLPGMSLLKFLDVYQHVSTVHFQPELFDHFAEAIGKCESRSACAIFQRHSRRRRNVREGTGIANDDQKESTSTLDVSIEEFITLSYLDKWHAFLFHPSATSSEATEMVTEALLGHSKFVTDVAHYNVISSQAPQQNDDVGANDTYYEYGFGKEVKYHELSPHFPCMKDELVDNDIHSMTVDVWDETLAKALMCLEMESVKANYRANDYQLHSKYSIKEGEMIGVDNVISLLVYCNFDALQADFSSTFREMNGQDAGQDIVDNHCRNFYWLGRSVH